MNRSSHFANLAGLVYEQFDDKLTAKLKKVGYTKVQFISKDGAQVVVLTNKDEQVLANWIILFLAVPSPYHDVRSSKCSFHVTFSKSYAWVSILASLGKSTIQLDAFTFIAVLTNRRNSRPVTSGVREAHMQSHCTLPSSISFLLITVWPS